MLIFLLKLNPALQYKLILINLEIGEILGVFNMPQYANSRGIGYNAWSNGNWSGFMNSYAATPLNTGATSGMRGITFFGQWSISAPWSGTYTFRIAADDFGSGNMGGNTVSVGGFTSGGNTTSRFFSRGESIVMQWSIGNSGGNNGDDFNGNPCAVAWTLDGPSQPPAPSASISVSPNPIIQGQCATLSWSSSGSYLYSANVTGQGNTSLNGSATVCPSDDQQYCISVSGEGGTTTRCTTLVVYIPPTFTITADSSAITAGQCTTLRWSTTGDASSLQWLSGNISNGNLNSNATVCPTDTTTYTGKVSGLGGEDTDSFTITVNQIPTGSFSVPETLQYGQQGLIEYETQYANLSINIKIYFRNNFGSTLIYDYDLPTASSTQLTAPDDQTIRIGTLNTDIVYDDFGPRYIDYVLVAQGNGGVVSITKTTTIIIDETPDNISIEESADKFRLEEPIYTPDAVPSDLIESQLYKIEGIDIPVEIKANSPIKVDINKSNDWKDLRKI
jgi:hypothetical protein